MRTVQTNEVSLEPTETLRTMQESQSRDNCTNLLLLDKGTVESSARVATALVYASRHFLWISSRFMMRSMNSLKAEEYEKS